MKQVLLKKVVIIVGKLTKSRVLQGGAGIRRALRAGMGQQNFPHHAGRGEDGARQNLVRRRQKPHPSDPLRPHCHP